MKIRTIVLSVAILALAVPLTVYGVVAITQSVGCGVIYCSFEQDGIATLWGSIIGLFGGLMALLGAIWVGQKQAEILARQTDIQAQQVGIASRALELENIKLRADLYDRRIAIYNAADAFLRYVLSHSEVPSLRDADTPEEREAASSIYSDFVEANGASKFLMGGEVIVEMDRIWDLAFAVPMAKFAAEEATDPDVKKEKLRERRNVMQTLREARGNLREVFSADLQISKPPPKVEPSG